MKSINKLSLKVAGIAGSFMMVTGVFGVAPAIAEQGSILIIDESVTSASSGVLREIAAENLVQEINNREGRTVISIDANAADNSAKIVIDPEYNLGTNGESFVAINNALENYGFDKREAIA